MHRVRASQELRGNTDGDTGTGALPLGVTLVSTYEKKGLGQPTAAGFHPELEGDPVPFLARPVPVG